MSARRSGVVTPDLSQPPRRPRTCLLYCHHVPQRRLRERQRHLENSTIGIRFGEAQFASLILKDRLANRESQAHSGRFSGKKWLKYAAAVLRRYPYSRITNGKRNVGIPMDFCR